MKSAPLGTRAFDLLVALIERRDRVVTKNELLDLVWPDLVVEENYLQVQVSTLRKLLGTQSIATIPGRGYRFALSAEAASRADAMPAVEVIRSDITSIPPGLPDALSKAFLMVFWESV